MTKTLLATLVGLTAILASLVALLAVKQIPEVSLGAAQPGIFSASNTVAFISVGSTSAVTVFEANGGCLARVISTASSTLMLSFGSSTPTAVRGHWQAASTTATYDSSIFGCGQWQTVSYAPVASSTITVIEFY